VNLLVCALVIGSGFKSTYVDPLTTKTTWSCIIQYHYVWLNV